MAKCLQQDRDFSILEGKLIRCWKSDHAIYEIQIKSKDNMIWTLSRRYREFLQLHEDMCKIDDAVKKIYFPPKKPFNNLSSKFLCKRLKELEVYLNNLLQKYLYPPEPLAHFIDWNIYEVHGITNLLAKNFFENGDMILKMGFQFEFNVLQIFSINQRLNSQSPPLLSDNSNMDFVHVMEFVAKIRNVKVTGSTSPFHSSNIIMNKLEFDMSRFNSIEKLELSNVDLRHMKGFDKLKETVQMLKISHALDSVKNVALGDLLSYGYGDWVFGKDSVPTTSWQKVDHLDLSHNYLHALDPSMVLFKKVKNLKLNNNLLTEIQHLNHLENLRMLNLSHNKLGVIFISSTTCPEPILRGRFGNLTELDLSYNQLYSTKLVEGLYSLVKLNMGNNVISEFEELKSLKTLQCLESLILIGNPICSKPGYRKFTLQLFVDRISEIKLDLRIADEIEISQLQTSTSESIAGKKNSINDQQQLNIDDNDLHLSVIQSVEETNTRNLEVSMESSVNEILIF